jgi:uncharacterized repeat protein (TIGR01451 family)
MKKHRKTNHYLSFIYCLLLSVTLGLPFNGYVQNIQISIINPAGVNVCDQSEIVDFEIINKTNSSLSSLSLTLELPTGIYYEASSLIDLSIYNIQEQNISNLNTVVFSSNDLPQDSTLRFSVSINADMSAITNQQSGSVFRNKLTLNYTDGSKFKQSNAYNLYYPVLSILSVSPTSKTLISGESFTRDITIVNAGNGRVANFSLTDIHTAGIDLQSVNIGSLNTTKDTISIGGSDFSSIGNQDNYFDSNESIIISEIISASGCESTTISSAITNLWGCSSQIESSVSNAHVSISLKTPSLSVSTTSELDACFGMNTASSHSITLVNNGLGRADNLVLDLYKSRGSGYQQDIFSRIDETTITYSIDQANAISTTPSTTYTTDNSGVYACLGNSPIGRILLSLPNLDAGQEIQINFETYHCNINICIDDFVKGWKYELDYTDVCQVNAYFKSGTGQETNNTNMSIFPESPTDINDDETKPFSFTVSSHNNDLPVGTGAKYRVVFDLPAGLLYSSLEFYNNILWSPETIDYNTSTNQLTAEYLLPLPSGFNITKAAFNLKLTGDCDMTGAQEGMLDIVMNVSYVTDETCNFEIPFVCDETVSVDLHCPSGEVCEGMRFDNFSFERISFGMPDNNQDGLADTSGDLDFNRIKTNRAMYGDTLRGSFTGFVNSSAFNVNWDYGYATQSIEKGTYLTPISASVLVYDASSGTYLYCTNLNLTSSTNGQDKSFTYDISVASLSTNCSDFDDFQYSQGDSVWVDADYRVSTNIGGDVQQHKSSNIFYLSNTENPTSNDRYQCGYYNDNYTLIGYYFKNASRNYINVTKCSKRVSQNFYLSIGDCCSNYNGGNLFPSEYRNWANIKTATVEIPANYTVSNVWMKVRRTKKNNSSSTQTINDISAISVTGNLYTFDLEQYYESNGGSIQLSDDGFSGTLYMDLSPNCDVPINSYQDLTWKFNFAKSDYLDGGETGFIEATNPDRVKFNPPELKLSSDEPIIDGISKTVTWDLKVKTNATSIDADNTWIHIKNPSGDLQILHVINDATQDTLLVDGDLYRLGFINGNSTTDLTIVGTYGACVADYITVYAGYECTSYPATFSDFTCNFTSIGLFVEPKPAQMQVSLIGQNIGDDCSTTVQVEVDISSVKFAAVDSIQVNISAVGNSMSFESASAQLQYPLSSDYQSVADPVSSNGIYTYHLVDLNESIALNGLPGVHQLNKNHVKLKFNMNLNSSFVPGHYVAVSISGQAVCGETIPTINLAFDPSIGFHLATNSGLTDELTDSWSSSWGDYNNDGYDDLFLTTYDKTKPNILYKNNGDKTFTKITTGAIVTDIANSVAATWGDYDNDGYLDLFVANNTGSKNFLYHNNGNSTFSRIMSGPIVEDGTYCHSASWADYDNDGYLDLFVAEYFPTKNNHLFHNSGDGTFTRVENSPVVTDAGHSIGAAWGDYNNDGLVDLFVPNTNNEPNWLYENIGNGQFVKVNEDVVSLESNSVGCSWGDYNNDGYLDLFIANSGNSSNFLYTNNGDGSFSSITTGNVVTDKGNSHGSTWIDIDNDGDLDLYVTNDQDQDNLLYRNEGDGSFSKIENDLTKLGGESFGTSISDYDKDGDYDLFVANHGDTENFFFENTKGQCSQYLCLNLIGTNSNRSAIGTKVRVKANIYGTDQWQLREVNAQSGGGAGGQNSLNVIFGLGDASLVDSLIIEWPSGYREVQTNINPSESNCQVYTEANGSLISGKAYVDDNLNCTFDDGEMLFKNVAIVIAPNGKKTYTDTNGNYSFYMNTGNYTLSAEAPLYYSQHCPINNGTHNVVVSEIGSAHPNIDFAFKPETSVADLTACLSTTSLRINFTNDYIVTYENIGTDVAYNDTLMMSFETGIDIVSSTLPWDYKDGHKLYWYFDAIAPQTSISFSVKDSITSNVVLGDYATNTILISSESPDADYSNNGCDDVALFVGAIDPNDKLVYPTTNIKPKEELTYRIRFQNVGNFPADHVAIYDTISDNLDLETLKNIQTSHKANFSILSGNVLFWEFKDINLIDSVRNEPESHGFVQFKILPKTNLAYGQTIENSALIVFDYYQNTPTNNTQVRLEPYISVAEDKNSLVVYPQPVVNQMTAQYKSLNKEEVHIQICDINGKLIRSEKQLVEEGWNRFDYYLGSLNNGMYLINIHSSKGNISQKILLIRGS